MFIAEAHSCIHRIQEWLSQFWLRWLATELREATSFHIWTRQRLEGAARIGVFAASRLPLQNCSRAALAAHLFVTMGHMIIFPPGRPFTVDIFWNQITPELCMTCIRRDWSRCSSSALAAQVHLQCYLTEPSWCHSEESEREPIGPPAWHVKALPFFCSTTSSRLAPAAGY